MPDTADQAVTDIPCATHPTLFSGADGEQAPQRDRRETQAVRLCHKGTYGGPCPLIEWCEETTDPSDSWTVRAGLTPGDRGHKRTAASERPDKTWGDCGSWTAINRHHAKKETTCFACCEFRRTERQARDARKAEQRSEVAA
jgi:hypothetical protein